MSLNYSLDDKALLVVHYEIELEVTYVVEMRDILNIAETVNTLGSGVFPGTLHGNMTKIASFLPAESANSAHINISDQDLNALGIFHTLHIHIPANFIQFYSGLIYSYENSMRLTNTGDNVVLRAARGEVSMCSPFHEWSE